MSDKNKGGKPAADVQPVAAQQVNQTAQVEEEAVPDERDQAELAAAREADAQAQAQPAQPEPEPEAPEAPEAPEVLAIRQAFAAFEDRITAYERENEQKRAEIEANEEKINELRSTLRTKFGGLFGQSASPVRSAPTKKQASNGSAKKSVSKPAASNGNGSRTRTNYGDGNSTGDLIAACLKKAKKPVNSEQLTAYLKQHGNTTNPSVELSRMVAKGLVVRPSRGFYEWAGE
jgi:hypothetical protein